MNLTRNTGCAYTALEHDLRQEIYANRIHGGQAIHSENKLAEKYNIGRTSVRIALGKLEKEGLVRKVKGSGTFVVPEHERPLYRSHAIAGELKNRQILFLSLSTAFSEETFNSQSTREPIFNGLTRVLQPRGYNLLFAHVGYGWQPPPCLLNNDICGIIFDGEMDYSFWEKYMKHLPCVGLHFMNPDIDCSWVMLDDANRSYQAVSYLFKLGHRRIAFLADESEEPVPKIRFESYLKAMAKFGLEVRKEWQMTWQRERINGELKPEYKMPDYRKHVAPAFSLPDAAPTAVICSDNWRALAAMRAIEKLGFRIPDDVSIMGGYNDKPSYANFTGFCDRMVEICAEAARMLVTMLDARILIPSKTVLLRPRLVIGGTTAAPRRK